MAHGLPAVCSRSTKKVSVVLKHYSDIENRNSTISFPHSICGLSGNSDFNAALKLSLFYGDERRLDGGLCWR